jgi:hypothetical protein
MENNLNQKVIRRYSQDLAGKVVSSFFSNNTQVDNTTILEVTPIKQVNLFVVKNLFDQWQREIRQLRSPFFNYHSPKVQEAMDQLKNALSRSIAIKKEDYQPLLEKSVEETLRLILSPYDYYKDLLGVEEEFLTQDYLHTTSKYIKINPFIMEALLSRIDNEENMDLSRENARHLLDEVVDQLKDEPDDVDPHLEAFSELLPISLEELYGTQRSNSARPEPEAPSVRRTLHDNLVKEEQDTLLDIHQRHGINDIRSHLTINQRFMFINTLFKGNENQFYETIEYVEKSGDPAAALNYLKNNFSHWDDDSDEVVEFYTIVRRRLM